MEALGVKENSSKFLDNVDDEALFKGEVKFKSGKPGVGISGVACLRAARDIF